MKNLFAILLVVIALVFTACQQSSDQTDETVTNNPLLKPSTLPFGVPDFPGIQDSDFLPAFEAGMKEHLEEVEQIANNTEEPTFENTFIALEKSGQTLTRVNNVFNVLTSANTNPTLQKVQEEVAPKLAAHGDAIYLNDNLFQRIQTIYNQRNDLNLDPESMKLVEYYYKEFVRAGSNLSEAEKTKLKMLNEEEATLSAQFANRLLGAAKNGALVVDDKSKLAGLSEGELDAAAKNAKESGKEGKWLIPLQNTTQQPDLQDLQNRETRQQLFEHSWMRAEQGDSNDTRDIIKRLGEIRAQQSKLLGFDNYAAWKLQDQMAKTPAVVEEFLLQLVPAATAKATNEAAEIQSMMDQENSGAKLQPWDWNFYAEKVRKAKYDLDDSQLQPYFELNNVLEKGVFYAAHELYGISFKERQDIPVYNEDVRVFDVVENDGSVIGLFYGDFYKRDNKSGGAWMDNIVGQSKLLGTKPVIYNVCNYSKPAGDKPTLISFDDVTTLFHEFGHTLHGFFADQTYPSLSGTNVARDFVEFPSQINEHWALYPSVLKNYAIHYDTGEPMPQELVDKIKKSSTFNQGYSLTELLAAANLDMRWHTITADQKVEDVDAFEKQALQETKLDLQQVPPRYRSSYFLHIWGHGYAAGYYAYLWTEMLSHDAYAWFEANGGMTAENGQRFRDMILSRGNTEDYREMFRNFTGHDPDITPMLKDRGLVAQ